MNKKLIRLTESDLHRIVKESVNRIVEDTKAQRTKDPMNQWFKDMDYIQKHREDMEYITKGGRRPKHWKKPTNEGVIIKEGGYYDDRMRYENSYKECLRLLEKAKSAIITDYSHDYGYNENDPYYQDLDNRQWSVINAIDDAIDACKKTALNGRGGTFDADNGYLSDPYFAGVNGG